MQFQKHKNTLLYPESNHLSPPTDSRSPQFYQINFFNQNQQKPNSLQPQQKTAYARIKQQELQNQVAIYQWRKYTTSAIIPILQYRILSSGNIFNPNPLIKITHNTYHKTLRDFGKLSIGQCLALFKEIIKSTKNIFDNFGFRQITESMVVLDEKGKIRVWMTEDFHLNPFNSLSEMISEVKTEKEALRAILHLVRNKCLQNKLSKDLFDYLEETKTFQELQAAIIMYQNQKKIIVPDSILPFAINTKMTAFGSDSIRLSTGNSNNVTPRTKSSRRENQNYQISFQERQLAKSDRYKKNIKNSNMTRAHSGFLSVLNPEQKNNFLNSNLKVSDLSQINKKYEPQLTNSASSPLLTREELKKKLSLKSCVFQQKFGNVKQSTFLRDVSQININDIQSPKLSSFSDDPFNVSEQILSKNGWTNHFSSLPLKSKSILKESITQGPEQNSHLKDLKLKKLHTMGRMLTQSILPVQQEFSEEL